MRLTGPTRWRSFRAATCCLVIVPSVLAGCRSSDATGSNPKTPGHQLGGISALLPFTDSGPPTVDPSVLSKTNIDGISVRLYWRNFYTNPHDPQSAIDWSGLDAIFARAAAAQKFVRLEVTAGFYSPAWVLSSVPVVSMPVPQGPLADSGSQPLPLPWSDVYLNDFLAFVDQLAVRYGSNAALEWISVTGPNSHNGEVNLPHGDTLTRKAWLREAADSGISGQANQIQWLQDKLQAAWYHAIDRFDAAFGSRGKHYTIALIDESFPIGGDADREEAYKTNLATYGATHYPHAFGIQTNGLNGYPNCDASGAPSPWWHFVRDYSTTLFTGFQTQDPGNLYCGQAADSVVLRATIDNAVTYQAHFLEIYSTDVTNPALASDITYAHQHITKSP